jgi:hypothetical protein
MKRRKFMTRIGCGAGLGYRLQVTMPELLDRFRSAQ